MKMNDLEKYRKAVFSHLNCSKEEKEYYFSRMTDSLEENTDYTFSELVDCFGEPESVAVSLLDNFPANNTINDLSQERRKAIRSKRILFVVIAVIIVFVVFFCFWDSQHRSSYGYMEGPTNITSWENMNTTEGGK